MAHLCRVADAFPLQVKEVKVRPNTINLDNYIGFRDMQLEYCEVPHSHSVSGITSHLKAMFDHISDIGVLPAPRDYLFVPGFCETRTHREVAGFLAERGIASTMFNAAG